MSALGQKQTLAVHQAVSALDQKRTLCVCGTSALTRKRTLISGPAYFLVPTRKLRGRDSGLSISSQGLLCCLRIAQPGRTTMVTYVVLAKFTDQGVKNAKDSPKRADAFKRMAKTFGVTVKNIFWTQGRYDIVIIVDAPDEVSATALNLSLSALGNIRTESLRAFSSAEMMKIVAKML